MKKYIIKYADGRECREINSYKSRNEASDALMEYLYSHNEYLRISDDDYLSPFDFILEEVECKEVNEVITDFESARKALSNESNRKVTIEIKDGTEFVTDISPKHIKALIALNKLFTIAQAWNKEDGFVSDFSDWEQDKWFPRFKYDEDAAGFVCANAHYMSTHYTLTNVAAFIGSRLCFKTKTRAEQFGKQFVELYNKVFL